MDLRRRLSLLEPRRGSFLLELGRDRPLLELRRGLLLLELRKGLLLLELGRVFFLLAAPGPRHNGQGWLLACQRWVIKSRDQFKFPRILPRFSQKILLFHFLISGTRPARLPCGAFCVLFGFDGRRKSTRMPPATRLTWRCSILQIFDANMVAIMTRARFLTRITFSRCAMT
jgi:hypothetical protein